MRTLLGIVVVFSLLSATSRATAKDVFDRVDHHFADSDGVKIHYVTIGKGLGPARCGRVGDLHDAMVAAHPPGGVTKPRLAC